MHFETLLLTILASVVVALPADIVWDPWQSSTATTATTTSSATPVSTRGPPWSASSTAFSSTANTKTLAHWNAWNGTKTVTKTKTRTTTKTYTLDHVNQPTSSLSSIWTQWAAPAGSSNSASSNSQSSSPNSGSRINDGSFPGNLDGWFRKPAMFTEAVPTATLVPTIHWSHDKQNPDHVKPGHYNQMYYADGNASPRTAHQMGWLYHNFTNNAVILDHSSLLTYEYSASLGSLAVSFLDKSIFSLAQSSWHTDMILVFNDGSCGAGVACYVKCTKILFDQASGTCSMSTAANNFRDAVEYFEFEWGNYIPGRKRGSGSGGRTPTGTPRSSTTGSSWGSGSSATDSASRSNSMNSGVATTVSGSLITSASTVVASGNYSFGDDNRNCIAPVDLKYGLPTACLGQFFDEELDDCYGYERIEETDFGSFAAQFNDLYVEDPTDTAENAGDDTDDNNMLDFKKFMKRGLLGKLWNAAVKVVAQFIPIEDVAVPYDLPITSLSVPLHIPSARQTVQSPWGQQVLIKSLSDDHLLGSSSGKIEIYCVDCGSTGTANIAGKVGVSVLGGVSSLRADLQVNLAVGLKIGIDAGVQYQEKFQKPLFQVPLSPLSIPEVITIGPSLQLSADLDLSIQAKGQLLAGGTLSLANAQASMDLVQVSGSASGWSPQLSPVFEAKGDIVASADFGLPLGIVIGVSALAGKFTADIALIDRPAIVAKAQAAVSANLAGASFVPVDDCTGISTSVGFKNDVYVTFPNNNSKSLWQLPEKNLLSHCIALPATSPNSTTPSSNNTRPTTTGDSSITPTSTEDSTPGATSNADATPTTDGSHTSNATSIPHTTGFRNATDNNKATGAPDNTTGSDPAKRASHEFFRRQAPNKSSAGLVDPTSATLNNATTNSTTFVVPDSNDSAYKRTDGYLIATLIDTQAHYQVLPCASGNLLLFGINDTVPEWQCARSWSLWTGDDEGDAVVADALSRIPLYYPDEIAATGVSRLRVADTKNIPRGAEDIILISEESQVDRTGNDRLDAIFYPLNRNGDTFYPAVCHYADGQPSKLFLMKDATAGLTMLLSKDIKFSITGGDVDACYYLPLVQGTGHHVDGSNGGLFWYGKDDDEVNTTSSNTIASTRIAASTVLASSHIAAPRSTTSAP